MAYSSDALQHRPWHNGGCLALDIGNIIVFADENHVGPRPCRPPPPTATAPPPPSHPPARLPIDDTRIREITELAPPAHLLREFPASERAATTTFEARQAIHRVLHGADDRLLVVVGPCSIHDYDAAIDYATRLAALRARARRAISSS